MSRHGPVESAHRRILRGDNTCHFLAASVSSTLQPTPPSSKSPKGEQNLLLLDPNAAAAVKLLMVIRRAGGLFDTIVPHKLHAKNRVMGFSKELLCPKAPGKRGERGGGKTKNTRRSNLQEAQNIPMFAWDGRKG